MAGAHVTAGHVVGQSKEQREGPISLLTRLYLLKQKQTKKIPYFSFVFVCV